ncbi:hypothetical protein CPB86DRAFT_799936 [Serendipita vermifera]|nr:hypothetical protein CPB86DRAFT_799936 [Serendipita vermifera]
MSTNLRYTPVVARNEDLTARIQQSATMQSAGSQERGKYKLEPNRNDDLKLTKEDTSQTFTNTDVGDILEIPNWPGPQTLEVTQTESLLQKMGYIPLLLPPFLFLALVLSAVGLDSNEKNKFGEFVRQACNLGPTVFPIAFSWILGGSLKTYGLYKSERGVKLGELERMIGSQTVSSFFKLAFKFKQIDLLCIVLGVLWILSPLGGQGILRMLSMRQSIKTSSEKIYHLNLDSASFYSSEWNTDIYRGMINGLYVASLWAPVAAKNATTDMWGSIKIPSIESLDFDHQGEDGVAVGEVQTYSSLLGITMNSTTYKTELNYSYTLNTTAFTAECQEPRTVNQTIVPSPSPGSRFVLETQPPVDTTIRRNISLITFPDVRSAMVHNCTITPNFLLAKVECHSGQCGVSRIKKLMYTDDQLAELTLHLRDERTWSAIVEELPKSAGNETFSYEAQTVRYLNDPQTSLGYDEVGTALHEIPIAEFSRRFAVVLNTYYQATIDPLSRLDFPVFPPGFEPRTHEKAMATVQTQFPDTYQRHWEWVISSLVASLAMLGVAILGIVLQSRVIVPDFYGHVSSMTRDNPYFPLPPSGCTLEGIERSILLKDVVVRIEDVAPNKKIGHLAFTMAGYKAPTEQPIDLLPCEILGESKIWRDQASNTCQDKVVTYTFHFPGLFSAVAGSQSAEERGEIQMTGEEIDWLDI